ncbi:MAG: AmmeMemoRadiSam system protein A [Anaerolineales bacterium]|nr:AmmeMemoRadiSam system protein A [Anaerolineales bacterium]
MDTDKLTPDEQQILLKLARQSLAAAVNGEKQPEINAAEYTPRLQAEGATFVTLTINGELRGCIGALEAYQSLAEDVREHAISAALDDFRFSPLSKEEVNRVRIEISRLTKPAGLDYASPEDLLAKLRPGIDGVVIKDGKRRATFLPQVWDKIPDPEDFLDNLCYKMGGPENLWRTKHLDVLIYRVEEFHE